VAEEFHSLEYEEVRRSIIEDSVRADGRDLTTVRPISGRVSVLPRAHGSCVFTRGETQALVATTLGTGDDEQQLDNLESRDRKTFMLHYNFPPFCTGETKPIRGPARREIGHGALAERAVRPILPDHEDFPYTVRIVSDILESNGSSSMASVCGGSLSLMDAGVPIKAPVAGIAMGLIMEGDRPYILTDILGLEDHLGDMDFKVAGTRDGITAIQMDIKIGGLSMDIMKTALNQAKEARFHVLDRMTTIIDGPRPNLSVHAPRIFTVKIRPDKVRDVIGPGGKVVRGIIEKTGVSIDIEDDGTIYVASVDEPSAKAAIAMIQDLTQEAEIGRIYRGIVKKIMDFGAFVEIFPGTDGLVHISQLDHTRVKTVTDIVKEGDEVMVKVLEIDNQGRIRLSRKEALQGAASDGK
jgi:polyribonucleotide nucleotidyltransferase